MVGTIGPGSNSLKSREFADFLFEVEEIHSDPVKFSLCKKNLFCEGLNDLLVNKYLSLFL